MQQVGEERGVDFIRRALRSVASYYIVVIVQTSVHRQQIGWGDSGSLATLHKMRSVANDAIQMPIVVETAHTIIRGQRARDFQNMALAVRYFLAQNFRFVPDPIGVELVRTPEYMIRQYHTFGYISGDCDDVAVLGAALGKAVGVPAKFVAIGFRTFGSLVHVFTLLLPSGSPIVSLDVTKPAGIVVEVRRRVEFPV